MYNVLEFYCSEGYYYIYFLKMRSLKTALGQFCPTREDNNCCAIILQLCCLSRRLAQLHKLARASRAS